MMNQTVSYHAYHIFFAYIFPYIYAMNFLVVVKTKRYGSFEEQPILKNIWLTVSWLAIGVNLLGIVELIYQLITKFNNLSYDFWLMLAYYLVFVITASYIAFVPNNYVVKWYKREH